MRVTLRLDMTMIAATCFLWLALGSSTRVIASSQADSFIENYRHWLGSTEEHFAHFQAGGILTEVAKIGADPAKSESYSIEHKVDGEAYLAHVSRMKKDPTKANEDQAVGDALFLNKGMDCYSLRRGAGKQVYTIDYANHSGRPLDDGVIRFGSCYPKSTLYLHTKSIPEMLSSPGHKISNVSEMITPEGSSVRIDFEFQEVGDQRERLHGWWTVDKSSYALREYEVQSFADGKPYCRMRGNIAYRTSVEGVPTPSDAVFDYYYENKDQVTYTYKLNSIDFGKPSADLYKLASYGLGKLDRRRKAFGSEQIAYIAFGAAGIFLFLSVALKAGAHKLSASNRTSESTPAA